ncbi:MMPL family transporter [Solimonas marina]|uniref:Membrane transport protein MMPL domain-containing protein n=1 Tax=Solimonas marina TaxID=2714601 RepID=A0A970B8C6_9GAMM|nr:hypothetical protein [Solimonas marina]NKF21246.1 hypothetical protein [Solimonas marina]
MNNRTRLLLWSAMMIVAGLWLAWAAGSRLSFETDIKAMLPQTTPDAVTRHALKQVDAILGRRSLYLIGAPDFATADSAAQAFIATLRASPAYADARFTHAPSHAEFAQLYGDAQRLLLTDRDRHQLEQRGAQAYADAEWQRLYSPEVLTRTQAFASDPLQLYGHYLAQLAPAGGALTARDGKFVLERDDGIDLLVSVTLADSPYRLDLQKEAIPPLRSAIDAARAVSPSVTLIGSGVLRRAAATSERIRLEIIVIGGLSLTGVLLVFMFCFRSPRPLLLVLLSLSAAMLVSLATVATVYGRIHIVALVFEACVVGLATDYSILLFSDRYRDAQPWNGRLGLRRIGRSIGVAMASMLLAYASFLVPASAGLRQMALLSISGLVAAYLTVVLIYPVLLGTPAPAAPAIAAWRDRLGRLRAPRRPTLALLFAAGGILLIVGGQRLRFIDDVRALRTEPPALLSEESLVRERLGTVTDTRFFLVEGRDIEALLQNEETLRGRLDVLLQRHVLGDYRALSQFVPSAQRQRDDAALLAKTVYADGSPLATLQARLGFPAQAFAQQQAAFEAARATHIDLATALNSPLGPRLRDLWLGKTGHGVASLVLIGGVADDGALSSAAAGLPDVRLIDRDADASQVLQHYRHLALFGLGGALLLIALLLTMRYGMGAGLRLMAVPFGSGLLTLATLGAFDVPATLFTVLALMLVVGLGVDNAVFLYENRDARPMALLATSIAALVSLFGFGLLSASATPFVHSLGLGVLLGTLYSWLLAVLVTAAPRQPSPAP